MATEIHGYSFKAKRNVPIENMELVRYKNGSYGVQGDAGDGAEGRVAKIISKQVAEELQAQGYKLNEKS